MKSLTGKRVLITGAAGGIGSAIVRKLVQAGSTLMLVDLDTPQLRQLSAETGQLAFPADLTLPESRVALYNQVRNQFGALDALVYCAGVNAFGLHDVQSDEQIDRIIRINLIAPIQLTRGLIPLLERGNAPVIVNLGSVFGHIGFPGFSLYSASKFGLRGYSETLRRELADGPVRVVWISPRATRTGMNAGIIDAMNEELKVNYDHPERVAHAVVAAIARPSRDRVIGFPETWFARINQVFPGMVDGSLIRQLPIIRKYNSIHKESKT
jgi:short-subunit dehydrogenase